MSEQSEGTKVDSTVLLACPFCGSPAIGSEKSFWYKAAIECANRLCETVMIGNYDKEPLASVAARWNHRTANTKGQDER